jgi:uncharacterized membrane protein
MESTKRSLAKTISWRVTGSGATFLITFLVSGDIKIAGTVALIQITANTLLYFLHERVWNKIKWGRSDTI